MAIRAMPADTSPEAFRVLLAVYRAMPAGRRLELALQLSDEVREIAAAGIRKQHPEFDEAAARAALAARCLRGLYPAPGDAREFTVMRQQSFLHTLVDRLDEAGIAYMVAGSYGSSHYGMPRSTHDIDLVIDPTVDQLHALCARLAADHYVSAQAAEDALRAQSMFNVIDFASGHKADLIIRKARPFSVEEFRRRQQSTLHGRIVYVATPEDIMLSKLEWDRITPSERQRQDALDVAVVQWPQLDQAYLGKWASELGVSDTLEAILVQASDANRNL